MNVIGHFTVTNDDKHASKNNLKDGLNVFHWFEQSYHFLKLLESECETKLRITTKINSTYYANQISVPNG